MERAADGPRPGCGTAPPIVASRSRGTARMIGHRAQQRAGVGMARRGEQFRDRRELDDAAEIHHGDIVGHLRDHAHVVGDQHQRHALGALQAAQQGKDLRLGRDVERGGRLVRDQDLRIGGQRQSDADTLAQAPAQLERIGVDAGLRARNADLAQQRRSTRSRAAALDRSPCARIASMIWLPTV